MRSNVVTCEEVETYDEVWAGIAQYDNDSPGETWAPAFEQMVGHKGAKVLDAGSGAGRGALALQKLGYTVACVDLVDTGRCPEAEHLPFVQACLWSDLKRRVPVVDYVFCCDVMEHVPKEFTMLTVSRLLEVAAKSAFFSITFAPDNFGVLIGKQLHRTVEPFVWWRDRLAEVGRVVEARDLLLSGLYLVEATR